MKSIFIIASLFLVLASQGVVAQTPGLDVSLTTQTPFPVEPGTVVEIEVQISNNENIKAENAKITIIPRAPFTLLPGEDATKTFTTIEASSSVDTTYKLKVAESAITNTYDVDFAVSIKGRTEQTEDVSIDVQGVPQLIIDRIDLDPEIVEAGGLVDLTLYVKNVGTGKARQLALTLNSTPELIPVLSDGVAFIGDLLADETKSATMKLSVDDNSDEKTYVMILGATYKDEANAEQVKTFDLGVPVSGTVQLDVLKSEPIVERNQLNIEIANKGTTDAKSVEARLLVDGELIDIDYTSQIKPTKKTTFSFPLPQSGKGTLEVQFTGPGLQKNTITKDIVFSSDVQNGGQNGSFTLPLIIIIIVIVGIFWWRRKKKKKKVKKN